MERFIDVLGDVAVRRAEVGVGWLPVSTPPVRHLIGSGGMDEDAARDAAGYAAGYAARDAASTPCLILVEAMTYDLVAVVSLHDATRAANLGFMLTPALLHLTGA